MQQVLEKSQHDATCGNVGNRSKMAAYLVSWICKRAKGVSVSQRDSPSNIPLLSSSKNNSPPSTVYFQNKSFLYSSKYLFKYILSLQFFFSFQTNLRGVWFCSVTGTDVHMSNEESKGLIKKHRQVLPLSPDCTHVTIAWQPGPCLL